MSHVIPYVRTVRTRENLKKIFEDKHERKFFYNKGDVLQNFIDSIPLGIADHDDFIEFTLSVVFSKPFTIRDYVTDEQKQCIKYLCANDSNFEFFQKDITRGQIKLWTIFYFLAHHTQPTTFESLVNWISSIKDNHPVYKDLIPSFTHDLSLCKNYFDTIHMDDVNICMGKMGYSRASINPSDFPDKRKTANEVLYFGIVNDDKSASLKKKILLLDDSRLLSNEKKQLRKNDPKIKLNLSEKNVVLFREIIGLKINLLAYENNFNPQKLIIVRSILNTVISHITALKLAIEKHTSIQNITADNLLKLPINELCNHTEKGQFLKIEVIYKFLEKYVPLIFRDEIVWVTENLIKTCFKEGLLRMNNDFEVSFPSDSIFSGDNQKMISDLDMQSLNRILLAQSYHISNLYTFIGYPDVYLLSTLDIFNRYKIKIDIFYDLNGTGEIPLINLSPIKENVHTLLSYFIFEYLRLRDSQKLYD